jgi:hypothetical protein
MARRQGPQLPSLIYDKAFEADGVMRPKAADSHQGQGRESSRNRPDRFAHSTPAEPNRSPCAGGVHRLSYKIETGCGRPKSRARSVHPKGFASSSG